MTVFLYALAIVSALGAVIGFINDPAQIKPFWVASGLVSFGLFAGFGKVIEILEDIARMLRRVPQEQAASSAAAPTLAAKPIPDANSLTFLDAMPATWLRRVGAPRAEIRRTLERRYPMDPALVKTGMDAWQGLVLDKEPALQAERAGEVILVKDVIGNLHAFTPIDVVRGLA
jgi:hypothetical protein